MASEPALSAPWISFLLSLHGYETLSVQICGFFFVMQGGTARGSDPAECGAPSAPCQLQREQEGLSMSQDQTVFRGTSSFQAGHKTAWRRLPSLLAPISVVLP